MLAKQFADGVPQEEFSVAALQGCELFFFYSWIRISFLMWSPTDLLKNKSQPEAAANGVGEWVIAEREMRERLKREKEEREEKERMEVRLSCNSIARMLILDSFLIP